MATVKYKVVECDKCKHSFKFKPKIIKIKRIGESVEKSYFLCPKCKHEYVVMYQDDEFKANLKEIECIRAKASKLKVTSVELEQLLVEHTKLHNRNLEISKHYKQIYGS